MSAIGSGGGGLGGRCRGTRTLFFESSLYDWTSMIGDEPDLLLGNWVGG